MYCRKRRGLIALLMVFAMLMAFSPPQFTNAEVSERLYELTEERTANSKTYLLDNGQLQTVVYAGDVHYPTETSKYEEIDNSLIGCVTSRKSGQYSYRNKANRFKARFSSDVTQFPVLLEYRDYSIAMRPKDTTSATGTLYRDISAEYKEMVDYYIDASSSIVYPEAYTNIDLIYGVNDNGVKELIVIKAPVDRSEFEFELMLGNVTGVMEGDNICFNDSGGKTVFTIDELFAVDAAGGYTDDVSAALVTNQGLSSIKLRVSEDYLNDPQREYPIIIDPSVMVTGATKTADAFVQEETPDTNYKMHPELFIGHSPVYGVQRSYIKFTLPTNISASSVSNVVMRLKLCIGQSTAMRAYRVTSSWTSGNITWNNKPNYASGGSYLPNDDNAPWYELDVTTVTRQHLAGTYANYGFVLISQHESAPSSSVSFYSSDAPSPNKPELVITYVGNYGGRGFDASHTGSNCMGYALDYNLNIHEKELGLSVSVMNGKSIQQLDEYIKGKYEAWMNSNLPGRNWARTSRTANIEGIQYKMVARCHFVDRQFNIAGNSRNFNGVFDFAGVSILFPTEFDEDFDYHWWYQCSDGYWAERAGYEGTIKKHNVTNPEVESLWWPGYFGYLNQDMLSPYNVPGEFRDIRGSYMYYRINLKGVLSV